MTRMQTLERRALCLTDGDDGSILLDTMTERDLEAEIAQLDAKLALPGG